ncbi:3-phosphoglycerate dehydrogenase family protein [Thermodesulfobacteriota bacterium]
MKRKKILVLNPVEDILSQMLEEKNYFVDHKPNISSLEATNIIGDYDGIIVRSYPLKEVKIGNNVKAIGRMGAGTNNIQVADMTDRGIVVFNAPGGNANAVAEETICAMIMAARKIPHALCWMHKQDHKNIESIVEREKKQFKGTEIRGKRLAVIGLGAIGSRVANLGMALGMDVIGTDPYLSVDNALSLDPMIKRTDSISLAVADSDYVTIHVPKLDETVNMINDSILQSMKKGAILLNLARGGLVDRNALKTYLGNGTITAYITDFPHQSIMGYKNVIALPHLGASTSEAGLNCATMIGNQVIDYLENGNIVNSVNFPAYQLSKNNGPRICIANSNVPKMIAKISTLVGNYGLNISKMGNRSRGEIAYNIIDVNQPENPAILDSLEKELKKIEDVKMVRIF